mmetsp:Transcript_29445/g.90266  ORF Transcript_29445/g.90266 Transcript_29445/m.90266 type:complete len:102 (-) Transcript_29445:57-362(-)
MSGGAVCRDRGDTTMVFISWSLTHLSASLASRCNSYLVLSLYRAVIGSPFRCCADSDVVSTAPTSYDAPLSPLPPPLSPLLLAAPAVASHFACITWCALEV